MKSRHFKWIPHFLDDDLRAKQLEGAEQLLDVLHTQEGCHFRDLITGDETWVCLDMKTGTIWLPADTELPVRVKRTIASEKACLSFSGEFTRSYTIVGSQKILHWIHHSFVKKCQVLRPLAQKTQPNSKNSQTFDFDSYAQCKGSHGKGNPREIGCFPIQTHPVATV
jgi:hypothetical protein